MSNLVLPRLSYSALSNELGARWRKKIGYATEATSCDGYVNLLHHGNLIAEIWHGGIWLSTAGYDTVTTSARLNKALTDNLPDTPYRIAIRDGGTVVIDTRLTGRKSIVTGVGRGVFIYDNGDVRDDTYDKGRVNPLRNQHTSEAVA